MATPERPRAAAAVMRTEGTEILLVKHRWRDGTTSWILPGGALLAGETPEEAVLPTGCAQIYGPGSVRRSPSALVVSMTVPHGSF
jgi:NUDIX domain